MNCKSVLFLLLLGATYSTSKKTDQTALTQLAEPQWKTFEPSITILNPKQIRHAEKAITKFLSRLAGPMERPIILRDTTSKPRSIQSTIGGIGSAIRRNLMEFAKACGLRKSVRQYEKSIIDTTDSEDWLTEVLLQGSLVFLDLIRMWNETSSTVYRYFRMHNVKLQGTQVYSSSEELGFLETLNDGSNCCSRLPKCLETKSTNEISKDLNQLLSVTKGSPKVAVKLLRGYLDKALQNVSGNSVSPNKFFCHLLSNDNDFYDKCYRSLARFDKCVCGSDEHRLNGHKIANNNTVFEAWISKVNEISDCKVRNGDDGVARVKCRSKRMPRNAIRQVKFVYETLLSRKLIKKSSINRVARNLGNSLEKCPWAKKIVDEICQFIWIYDEGNRRVKKMEKIAEKNAKAVAKHRKLTESLRIYKDGLLKETFVSIENVHRSSASLEKLLIKGMKNIFNETWQGHIKVLSSMTGWMMNLLELVELNGSSQEGDAESPVSTEPPTASTDSMEADTSSAWESEDEFTRKETYGLQEMQKAVDLSFNKFMRALVHVRTGKLSGRSTLACLANNLLLVTIFMETIGFVSTLFCLGQNNYYETGPLDMKISSHSTRKRSLEIQDLQNETDANIEEDTSVITNDIDWTSIQYDEDYIPAIRKTNVILEYQLPEQNFTVYNNDT